MRTKEIIYALKQVRSVSNETTAEDVFFMGIFSIFFLLLLVALINIFASLVRAIIENKSSWKKKPDSELMYSFAAGSGMFQLNSIFMDAIKYMIDRKWPKFSFASLAYRLGNFQNDSKFILFLGTFAYLPLAALGALEMIFRLSIGFIIYLYIFIFICPLLLLGFWVINLILMPLFKLADRFSLVTQHCPNCYATFKLPAFECPHCGKQHSNLFPGRCGLLFARCTCGHFIPCASLSKRKKLKSYCPKCGHPLAGPNLKALTIQVVGGTSSGKTAYIAAFQHQYVETVQNLGVRKVSTSPEDDFRDLERMYRSGKTDMPSPKVRTYYILHDSKGSSDDCIVIYDVPGKIILNEQYERNPLNFAYSDGIVIIIDPLSVRSVREECEKTTGPASTNGFSENSPEDVLVQFINKYSEVAGRAAKKMSDTPIAVVITKMDLTVVRRKIGPVKIKAEYAANQNQYSSLEDARDKICKKYLVDIGLVNVINNLESVFSKVSYFPVSSMGHFADGSPFDPQNVIAPIAWLAQKSQSGVKDLTALVQGEIK